MPWFKRGLVVLALLAFNVFFYDVIMGAIMDSYIQDALQNRGCLIESDE